MTPAPDASTADRVQRTLVTLTGNRGLHGIEDSPGALTRPRSNSTHPCCITIHDETMDNLPCMYGPAEFAILDQARKAAGGHRRITP